MRSNEQLAKIETLHEYTKVDKEECERMLERSDWNVEVAIARVLDASAEPAHEATEPLLAGEQSVGPRRRIRPTQSGVDDQPQSSTDRPARDVGREYPVGNNPLALLGSGLSLVGKKLVLDPLRSVTGINGDVPEEDAAQEFLREFKEKYGDTHPDIIG